MGDRTLVLFSRSFSLYPHSHFYLFVKQALPAYYHAEKKALPLPFPFGDERPGSEKTSVISPASCYKILPGPGGSAAESISAKPTEER